MGASERDEFLRAAWRVTVAEDVGAERFVFVDECGANTSLHRLYAWSRRGERAPCCAPRNWGANVTLLASMTLCGMGPCLAVEGPTTKAVFETYLERVLAPSLCPGQVVVMDNLSSHKGPQVRQFLEARGCELLYLPAYSPHRRSVCQDKGAVAQSRGAHPRSPLGSDGRGSRHGDG